MDSYDKALSGSYGVGILPALPNQGQIDRGYDAYMQGVYQNPFKCESYYYGFRTAHTEYRGIENEVS